MSGSTLADCYQQDINEVQSLLSSNQIQSSRIQKVLRQYAEQCATSLRREVLEAVTPSEKKDDTPAREKSSVVTKQEKSTPFHEIAKFGWEDAGFGQSKVSVYIMSGVDGVGALAKDQITCDFTSTSFDLKIMGLGNKNYRLVKHHLDKPIDPTASSFRVKQNRITLSLVKKDKNSTWMNLTAKNPGQDSAATNSKSDPSAGIMDLMKNMYDEGDANMKKTIAQAWTDSRNKNPTADLSM